MIIDIAGHEVEIPHIVTGLLGDPFASEPVVPKRHELNWVELEALERCAQHPHYRGFKPPNWTCGVCWRNYGELLGRDYQRRSARAAQRVKREGGH